VLIVHPDSDIFEHVCFSILQVIAEICPKNQANTGCLIISYYCFNRLSLCLQGSGGDSFVMFAVSVLMWLFFKSGIADMVQ
jgi:hypothetical protein